MKFLSAEKLPLSGRLANFPGTLYSVIRPQKIHVHII